MDASEDLLIPAPDLRIGQIVHERYRIVRKLGEGGFGAVYEGEHQLIQRRVAIKCLHAHLASNADVLARFRREAMATNAIRHPNIVEVTDMGRFDDGTVFMVLELLEGRDLAACLDEGTLSIARVVHIVSQVCDALSAAHEHGIVHRDLKPDNIFLVPRKDDPDFVKVLDFGIAKFRKTSQGGVTRTGTPIGTPEYMSPEQVLGSKDVDHRTDIYALGVVLFEAITGRVPFQGESFVALAMNVMESPAPRLRTLAPDAPPELDELIDRMLSKDVNVRPRSCAEVKAALARFSNVHDVLEVRADTMPAPAKLAAPPSASDAQPRRWLWAVSLVLVLLVAGVVVQLSGVLQPSTPTRVEAAPAAAASSLVRVQIEARPPGAQLWLDGRPIANPYDADLPHSEDVRSVEARMEGYRSVARSFVVDAPQRIRIDLVREAEGADPPEVASSSERASRRSRTAARGRSQPTEAPAAEAPAQQPREQPAHHAAEPEGRTVGRGFIDLNSQL